MALPFKSAFKEEQAQFGSALDDTPSWPALYSTLISISLLLFSTSRLWQLRTASVKIKAGGGSHIKVVCDDAPSLRLRDEVLIAAPDHYNCLFRIAVSRSDYIQPWIFDHLRFTAFLQGHLVFRCSCIMWPLIC
jgi:hypothetical protein